MYHLLRHVKTLFYFPATVTYLVPLIRLDNSCGFATCVFALKQVIAIPHYVFVAVWYYAHVDTLFRCRLILPIRTVEACRGQRGQHECPADLFGFSTCFLFSFHDFLPSHEAPTRIRVCQLNSSRLIWSNVDAILIWMQDKTKCAGPPSQCLQLAPLRLTIPKLSHISSSGLANFAASGSAELDKNEAQNFKYETSLFFSAIQRGSACSLLEVHIRSGRGKDADGGERLTSTRTAICTKRSIEFKKQFSRIPTLQMLKWANRFSAEMLDIPHYGFWNGAAHGFNKIRTCVGASFNFSNFVRSRDIVPHWSFPHQWRWLDSL